MRIAGFDCCSKSVACVVLDSKKKFIMSYFYESKHSSWEERFKDICEHIDNSFKVGCIDVAYIEGPIYMQNIKATAGITRVIGLVESHLARHNIPFFEVDNKSWKKGVLGNGKASKDDIMRLMKVNYGDKIKNQDIADAASIALWGVLRSVS